MAPSPPRPPAVTALIRRVDAALAAGAGAEAVDLARQAETLAPDDPAARQRLGRALRATGRAAEAVPHLAAAATAVPQPGLWDELAEALIEAGDRATAITALRRSLDLDPGRIRPTRRLLGLLLKAGRAAEASALASQALRHLPDLGDLPPHMARAWRLHAAALREAGTPERAEALLRQALDVVPNDWTTLVDLGVILRALNRVEEAVASYRAALERGESGTLHANLGNALALLGHAGEAETHLRRAVELDPGAVLAHYNLGTLMADADRPEDALEAFSRALALKPGDVDVLTNMGVALVALGRVEDAVARYREALATAPDAAETHYDLAWALLLDGDLDEGWAEYEWRWRLPRFSSPRRALAAPAWDGAPLDGTLLLHAEQGLGDAVWMLRFAAWARARCRRLVLLCPPPLAALAATAPGVDAVVPDDGRTAPPPFDAHLPMMSLPRLAGSAVGLDAGAAPYLSAPPVPLDGPGPHVGLVWAGNPDNKLDRARSIPFPLLRPLVETPGITLHGLQVGPGRRGLDDAPDLAARLVDHGPRLHDFAATASLLASLDLVVCVDTAVAHVAGALGRPGLVLLPLSPGLPWRLRGEASPWYPTLRLLRQERRGDWAPVIAAAARVLRDLAGRAAR